MRDAPMVPEILQKLGYDHDLGKTKLFEAIRPLFKDLKSNPSRWSHLHDRNCREEIANRLLRQEGESFWGKTSSQKLQLTKDREKIRDLLVVLFFRMIESNLMVQENSAAQNALQIEENNQGDGSHENEEQAYNNRFSLTSSHYISTRSPSNLNRDGGALSPCVSR
ncbi:hypothetical protein EDB81DRAFT_761729 [Dactylonectria macrodidyma]|uniref:Uncharacterized protein n=1 Tax=Dactylonectria macrodidyma TaxID=307937 RepID=A0A9P9EJ55_9HYPO|nr:hypothetical protein EDB81DRAFT_761729 [Dactylonectria macrodidyma]